MTLRIRLLNVVLVALSACAEGRGDTEAGAVDVGGEGAADVRSDALDDLHDASVDVGDERAPQPPDAAVDVSGDLVVEAPSMEAAVTPMDAPSDVSLDSAVEVGPDGVDAPSLDHASDVSAETPVAPQDVALDALDVVSDASPEPAGRWTTLPLDPARLLLYGVTRLVWTGRELVVWGIGAARIFTPATGLWSAFATANAPPGMATPLTGYNIVWDASSQLLYVVGNANATVPATEPLRAYNFRTSTWSAPGSQGIFGLRRRVGIAVGGDRLFAFGGVTVRTNEEHNTGGLYNLGTRVWNGTPTAGAPSARTDAVVVYTGREFLVYGGVSSTLGPRNDGALYNPTTNTWRAMSSVGAPSRRSAAATVWTGTDLYVWGGVGASAAEGRLADGAGYNVASDTWTPLAPSPLAARDWVASAWTGSEVFIWGGVTNVIGGGATTETGALYNPTTRAWRLLTPSPRGAYRAGAAWIGDAIAVAGGEDFTTMVSPPAMLWRP